MTAGIQPTTRHVDFGVLVPLTVYFDDFDPMGLLHNSRYAVLVERAWIAYWESQGFGGRKFAAAEGDEFNVVKDLHIVFDLALDRAGSTPYTCGSNPSAVRRPPPASASAPPTPR